jgi:hypothetical protein
MVDGEAAMSYTRQMLRNLLLVLEKGILELQKHVPSGPTQLIPIDLFFPII